MLQEIQPDTRDRARSDADVITLRGVVEALFYAGPRFSAGRIRTDTGERVPFAGKLFVKKDDYVVVTGRWGTHAKYGRQFEVAHVEYDHALDPAGLAHYLATNPAIRGIGPVKARAIAERCGTEFDRIIREEPEGLAKAVGVSLDTVRGLRDEWIRTQAFNSVATWLAAFGLTHHQIVSLVERLGNDARAVLESDPYILVREIPGFGFKRVDKIARQMGTPKDHAGRLRAGVIACIEDALAEGHTWVEYEELVNQANTLLVMDTLDARERIEHALDTLIEEGALSCISTGDRFLIAKPMIQRMEEELAAVFHRAGRPNPHVPGADVLAPGLDYWAPDLNEGQRHAVETTLRHSISLVSGGAGVGKTFTMASIARIYEERDLSVVLAAPTGKAAKRLEEVAEFPASTVHRLLGYKGDHYTRGPDSPINADVLIVDEVSMVDVPLAWHLFRAIDLARTAVVLVGDHNQLPPVGPGNILRDLIQSRAIPTVILETVVRQAGVLKENCQAVLHGEVRRSSEPDPLTGRRAWYVADQFSDVAAARAFILDLFEHALAEKLSFDLIQDVILLTPTHKGPLGTIELNIALQRLIQRKYHGVDVPPPPPGRRARILLHDRVIQTRNNYDLGVMNGAMGTVIGVEKDGAMTVAFEDRTVRIESGSTALRDLQLAYALTIHKTQGSEFPCVIAIIHKAHSFQHHRNLLYTAVTRARNTVILVGDSWGMRNCAHRRQVDERRTFLPFFLAERVGSRPEGHARAEKVPATFRRAPVSNG